MLIYGAFASVAVTMNCIDGGLINLNSSLSLINISHDYFNLHWSLSSSLIQLNHNTDNFTAAKITFSLETSRRKCNFLATKFVMLF